MSASRRDGSPFLNLLLVAPLFDCHGVLRYFVGAQVDVTQVLLDGAGMDSLAPARGDLASPPPDARGREGTGPEDGYGDGDGDGDVFRELTELFNDAEIETARRFGGRMHSGRHRLRREGAARERGGRGRSRVVLKESSPPPPGKALPPSAGATGAAVAGARARPAETAAAAAAAAARGVALKGVYQNYLLVRPYPSLRILFTSPSLRTPGIHQLHFLHKIGGSARVRDELHEALRVGKGVTAKVLWLTSRPGHHHHPAHGCLGGTGAAASGRERWVHCTPLLDAAGDVGVWMVIVVDPPAGEPARRQMREAVYELQNGHVGGGGGRLPTAPKHGSSGSNGGNGVGGDDDGDGDSADRGVGTVVGDVGNAGNASNTGGTQLGGYYPDDAPPSRARLVRFETDSDGDGDGRSELRAPSRAAPPPAAPVPAPAPVTVSVSATPPPPLPRPPPPLAAGQSPMFRLSDYIPPRKSSRHHAKSAESVKKS